LSLEYFGGKRTGDLIARISSDTDHLCSFLSDTLIDFITDVLMIVSTCVVLIMLDPLLAVAAIVSFPPIAWLIIRIRGKLTHGYLRGGRVWSAMTNILADTIPGIRVVKAFSQERREIARFAQANQRIVEVNNRNNALWTFFWPLVALLNQVGLLVVWAVGARQVLHHQITVGVLTAFIAYISRFYTRVESMSRMLTATQRASAAAQRLFEILDRVPSVLDPKDPIPIGDMRGEIEFERVSFRYGSRLVLDDVSFKVAPGQMIGIVGHTGSGKSTVANLLCRFYDVSAGAVRVDGHDIRRFPSRPTAATSASCCKSRSCSSAPSPTTWAMASLAPSHADHRGRARGARARLHPEASRMLRLAGGRARPVAVRRRAPAHRHRARHPGRSAHPRARRGDLRGGHAHRARDPARPRQRGRWPHHHRHRPPPEHLAQGGLVAGDQGRPPGRARNPCRVARARRGIRAAPSRAELCGGAGTTCRGHSARD
jgi:energy-coupling factor transporter ATP-binding protein EcfA2